MKIPSYQFEHNLAAATTPPARWYTDPDFLVLEHEKIFGRTWQLAGRSEQVAQPGQFFTVEMSGESVIIIRGDDGKLRALSNVCRHRAGPLAVGAGNCKRFRCAYHGWTYALDGALLGTPEFDGIQGFDQTAHVLPQFQVKTWGALIFVNLDRQAAPLDQTLEDLPERLANRKMSQMKLAARKEWTLECNWKVYVDNYLEGYHIPSVHPGLNSEINYSAYYTETKRYYSIQHSPLRREANGRVRTGDGTHDAVLFAWIFPNLMLNVYPDNYSTNLIIPLGPERTLTVFEWYFTDPEAPATQEKVKKTIEFSDEIQIEDIKICEAVQKGLRSRHYTPGRYSVKRENGVHHFHGLMAQYMK